MAIFNTPNWRMCGRCNYKLQVGGEKKGESAGRMKVAISTTTTVVPKATTTTTLMEMK